MEHENINELTGREEACKKVKQIAEVIKKLKINNYLKIGGLSEEDRTALSMLEKNMDTIAEENGLQKLASELKATMSARYDVVNRGSNNSGSNKDAPITDKDDPKFSYNETLEAYRGAVDAEKQALETGKISKAKRCQAQASQYMNTLDEERQKRAIEYKRALFLELSISLDNTKENVEKWKSRYQGCLRPKDFSDRAKIAKILEQMTKGCDKENGEKYAGSDDRSI